jgi:hypothetical protein
MAEAWNVTLVGYVRRDSMRVYAHPERLGGPAVWETPLSVEGRTVDHGR